MKLVHTLACAALVASTFVASSRAEGLDDTAACAGIVIGNGAVDYSNNDEPAFDSAGSIAYAAFLGHIMSGNYSKEDLQLADQILASNVDFVIEAANSGTFSNETYEQVIGCYRALGLLLLEHSDVIAKRAATIKDAEGKAMSRMKRLLNAGR